MRISILTVLPLVLLGLRLDAGDLAKATAGLPEIDAPPQGETQWIAKSMRMNGLPMTLKSFHSRLSADSVLHHYEAWSRRYGGSESARSRYGEWHMLAIRSARHYISIQARSTVDGSHGTIAVSRNLQRARVTLDTQFPIPPHARIVNLQQYDDFGMESEHISLSSARAPHLEAFAFSRLLAREGWQLVRKQPAHEIRRGHVIEAQKGAQHARLTIMPDQSSSAMTAVLIVWKKT